MSIMSKGFLGVLAVIALLVHGTAFAQATFTSSGARVTTLGSYDGYLFAKWSESGLSPDAVVLYSITGTSMAVYACTASGSTCQAFASPGALLTVTMTASGNGTIRQSVAVPPAGAGSCSCTSGQLVLYRVSYGNSATAPDLQVCDDSNPSAGCVPIGSGYFSQTLCKLSNLQNCPPAS